MGQRIEKKNQRVSWVSPRDFLTWKCWFVKQETRSDPGCMLWRRGETGPQRLGATEEGVINLVCAVNWMGWDLGKKKTQTEVNLKVPANKRCVVASIACGQITSRERYRHEAGEDG